MASQNFYADLPALSQFIELANPDNYVQVPDDWYVLITDVTRSTEAIAAGKYRQVNLIGAASIIAVLNAVRPAVIPFAFGGDGASLLIPGPLLHRAREAALAVRAMARQSFGMDLRVGVVPVATTRQRCALKVAKLMVNPGCHQASFMGGGITYADALVKGSADYRLEGECPPETADLSGLECRWQEVPSPHGATVSLIVAAMASQETSVGRTYADVLQSIQDIYGAGQAYHPIGHSPLKLSFNPLRLHTEVKARSPMGWWPRLAYLGKIMVENLLGTAFMALGVKIGGVDWRRYRQAVAATSDYQKIDDTLRMVLSGSSEQIRQLTAYLDERTQAGQLAYGLHLSNRALLTCVILDRSHHHIHFVDGADGGYAIAAKALKSRLRHKAQNLRSFTRLAKQRPVPPLPWVSTQPFSSDYACAQADGPSNDSMSLPPNSR